MEGRFWIEMWDQHCKMFPITTQMCCPLCQAGNSSRCVCARTIWINEKKTQLEIEERKAVEPKPPQTGMKRSRSQFDLKSELVDLADAHDANDLDKLLNTFKLEKPTLLRQANARKVAQVIAKHLKWLARHGARSANVTFFKEPVGEGKIREDWELGNLRVGGTSLSSPQWLYFTSWYTDCLKGLPVEHRGSYLKQRIEYVKQVLKMIIHAWAFDFSSPTLLQSTNGFYATWC